MARTTYVKKAQQRYATVTVKDENGQPKKVPVLKRNGEQKTTKKGRPIYRRVTVVDKTKPKPNRTCEKCKAEIKVGDPYKWIAPKSGPYGGSKRYRCGKCPGWQVWEYSYSLSARLAQLIHNAEETLNGATTIEDLESARDGVADEITDFAEEEREKATNIEEGFGHPTYKSEEMESQADEIEQWGDEVRDVENYEESAECETCGGDGEVDCYECDGEGGECPVCDGAAKMKCEECDGTGKTEDAAVEQYREEIIDALNNCPF